MTEKGISVGRPGDLIWPGTHLSPSTWHVGGAPWYPASCGIPESTLLQCKICNEMLRCILHVRRNDALVRVWENLVDDFTFPAN